jgi:hypothetical protein
MVVEVCVVCVWAASHHLPSTHTCRPEEVTSVSEHRTMAAGCGC